MPKALLEIYAIVIRRNESDGWLPGIFAVNHPPCSCVQFDASLIFFSESTLALTILFEKALKTGRENGKHR
jgi:hypothetical protein